MNKFWSTGRRTGPTSKSIMRFIVHLHREPQCKYNIPTGMATVSKFLYDIQENGWTLQKLDCLEYSL